MHVSVHKKPSMGWNCLENIFLIVRVGREGAFKLQIWRVGNRTPLLVGQAIEMFLGF